MSGVDIKTTEKQIVTKVDYLEAEVINVNANVPKEVDDDV